MSRREPDRTRTWSGLEAAKQQRMAQLQHRMTRPRSDPQSPPRTPPRPSKKQRQGTVAITPQKVITPRRLRPLQLPPRAADIGIDYIRKRFLPIHIPGKSTAIYGSGNFAQALRVRELRHERPVGPPLVLKFMHITSKVSGQNLKVMFQNESGVLQHLQKHKCNEFLVCIRHHYLDPQLRFAYFTMEEVPHAYDLLEWINENRLDPKQLLVVIRMMLQALYKLHVLKVAHRDIKLENMLLRFPELDIRLIDYGLSCFFSGLRCLRQFAGTVRYMSPELFARRSSKKAELALYAQSQDIWAMGISVFLLVFDVDPITLAQQVKKNAFFRPNNFTADLLQQLVEEAWARKIVRPYLPLRAILDPIVFRLLDMNWRRRATALRDLVHGWDGVVRRLPGHPTGQQLYREARKKAERAKSQMIPVRRWPRAVVPRALTVLGRVELKHPTLIHKRTTMQTVQKLRHAHPPSHWKAYMQPPYLHRFLEPPKHFGSKMETFVVDGKDVVKTEQLLTRHERNAVIANMQMTQPKWVKVY